jgi:hypothetical protein
MPMFIPGLELSRAFYVEAVKPIIDADFPSLRYTAGLIGPGSEVLGFDTEMSSDHCWGPRMILFLQEEELRISPDIDNALRRKLPGEIRGYSTHRGEPDPNDNGTWRLEAPNGEINHGVQIETLRKYVLDYFGFDIEKDIDAVDWLTFPSQKLRTLSSENIFHDDIGVRDVLDRFAYYPHDVWLYLLSAGWTRVSQEEHLMGRAGSVGDEIGSAIIASRIVRDLMNLCFLMERQYAPYPKWFGTAFSRLECGAHLSPIFTEVLAGRAWKDRENYLMEAYRHIAEMHDNLGITEPINAKPGDFFGRPFKVIHLHGMFSEKIAQQITDPTLKSLTEKRLIGGIDLISDNTDVLSDPSIRNALRHLYE